MIVVIQCAGSKRPDAKSLTCEGVPVLFVADPAKAPPRDGYRYARPDDRSPDGSTWREQVRRYNAEARDNPLGLSTAYELYGNPVYQRLVNRFGADKVYILSAGWGLIEANYLIPAYDITFSSSGDDYQRRRQAQPYDDFRMLPADTHDRIVFFGGKDYLPLFCRLTESARGDRFIFYNSATPPPARGCKLRRFATSTRTNWHYECANAVVDGRIGLDS